MAEEEGYSNGASATTTSNNKRKFSPSADTKTDIDSNFAFFDELTDDLVLEIISKLGSTASRPAHFFNLLLTSKRMNELGFHPTVLKNVSLKVFPRYARNWGREALEFTGKCVIAGNVEAIYTIGMLAFYLFGVRDMGRSLIEAAAALNHPAANHTLAIIQINGSGATEDDADLKSAINNFLTAASLGHVDATLELGYLKIDGYGVYRDVEEGARLVLQANVQEIFLALSTGAVVDVYGTGSDRIPIPVPRSGLDSGQWLTWVPRGPGLLGPVDDSYFTTESDFGWDIPYLELEPHPVNYLLIQWYQDTELRSCYRALCGRPETRRGEFYVCPFCDVDCYCSRACQAVDWKRRHHRECTREYGNEEENYEDDIAVVPIQEGEVDNEVDLQENEEQV